MSVLIEIHVPDIGDFTDVPVIEVLVEAGEHVDAEQSLLTLESDKATMEIPAPVSGTVTSLAVGLGDSVSEGSLIATLEADEASAPEAVSDDSSQGTEKQIRAVSGTGQDSQPSPSMPAGDFDFDVLVLGSGPGGYTAAFRAADLGLNVALV